MSGQECQTDVPGRVGKGFEPARLGWVGSAGGRGGMGGRHWAKVGRAPLSRGGHLMGRDMKDHPWVT